MYLLCNSTCFPLWFSNISQNFTFWCVETICLTSLEYCWCLTAILRLLELPKMWSDLTSGERIILARWLFTCLILNSLPIWVRFSFCVSLLMHRNGRCSYFWQHIQINRSLIHHIAIIFWDIKLHQLLKMFHSPFSKQAVCYNLETFITKFENFCSVLLLSS